MQIFVEHLTESLALCCARRLEPELNKAHIVHLLEALAAGMMSGSGPVCLVKDKGGARGSEICRYNLVLGRQSGLWSSDRAESWNGIFQAEAGSQVRREMVQHLDTCAGGFISDPGEGKDASVPPGLTLCLCWGHRARGADW